MPLYRPPQPSPALARALGAIGPPPERKVRREDDTRPDIELYRAGVRFEDKQVIDNFQSTDPEGTMGDYSLRRVSEVDASGNVRERNVLLTDIGAGRQVIVGTPGNLSLEAAQGAVDAGAKSESAGNALGADAESDPATQGVTSGSAQTGGDYEYVSSGPVTVNGVPLDEWYAAQQYDSSLGIGQPVYSPSTSDNPYYDEQASADAYEQSYYESYEGGSPGFFEGSQIPLPAPESDPYDPSVYESGYYGGF